MTDALRVEYLAKQIVIQLLKKIRSSAVSSGREEILVCDIEAALEDL